jgi:hypothetical protein
MKKFNITSINRLLLLSSSAMALQPSAGYGLFFSRGFLITHNVAPQSVGILWMSDQLIVETSISQHTTHTTEKHPCPPVGFELTIAVDERP